MDFASPQNSSQQSKPTPGNGGEALGFNELSALMERRNWSDGVLGTFTIDFVFHSCD
jgi:hypothetical protein